MISSILSTHHLFHHHHLQSREINRNVEHYRTIAAAVVTVMCPAHFSTHGGATEDGGDTHPLHEDNVGGVTLGAIAPLEDASQGREGVGHKANYVSYGEAEGQSLGGEASRTGGGQDFVTVCRHTVDSNRCPPTVIVVGHPLAGGDDLSLREDDIAAGPRPHDAEEFWSGDEGEDGGDALELVTLDGGLGVSLGVVEEGEAHVRDQGDIEALPTRAHGMEDTGLGELMDAQVLEVWGPLADPYATVDPDHYGERVAVVTYDLVQRADRRGLDEGEG